MIEAVSIAAVGPDVIVVFQLWDMDALKNESTLLVRTGLASRSVGVGLEARPPLLATIEKISLKI